MDFPFRGDFPLNFLCPKKVERTLVTNYLAQHREFVLLIKISSQGINCRLQVCSFDILGVLDFDIVYTQNKSRVVIALVRECSLFT